jgi:GT2 family glycosyltransferase
VALNIVIGIATVGRPATLCETLSVIARQTRRADRVIVCGAKQADVVGAADIEGTEIILSKPGLPAQRNALIAAAPQADVMLFFDDDFLPAADYVAMIERHMAAEPGTVIATGMVLADGIYGPGLDVAEAQALLRAERPSSPDINPVFSGYGCNMAVRLMTMRQHGILFDERLPLYGWLEDADLSRRLAPYGAIVKINAAFGVHLGIKQGKNSGLRLGYSQVANPLYIAGKGAGFPLKRALNHIARNFAMNIVHSPRPEPYVDRRGRLRGNLMAFGDLVRKRMAPERVLEL